MGQLEILSRHEAESLNLDWPDLYFSPAYGRVVEHSDQGTWHVAIWRPGPIILPFLLRVIPTGQGAEGTQPSYDIVSPYGYSGCCSPEEVSIDQWHAFRVAFREEMKRRGVVSEFLRLGSLIHGRESLLRCDTTLTATRHNDTIVVNTSADVDSYWDRCEGRSRTAVRKALRLGYTAITRPVNRSDFSAASWFRTMYEATMQRVAAQPYYFFDDAYFTTLYDSLADQLRWFIVYRPDGVEAVMALTFVWAPHLHLHLVASEPAPMRDGAGNLCYDGMLRWACENKDIHGCHLGGGLSADDPLFKFKKSFGGVQVPFWVASSILDLPRYHALVNQHAETLGYRAQSLWACRYFPAYRAPASLLDKQLQRAA